MRDRPKTKSQRKAARVGREIEAQARAMAVHDSAAAQALNQSADRTSMLSGACGDIC